ncbi:tyrosyl-tRNA synthetase, partial [Vibrio alginolyticus 12G01]
CGSGKKNSAKIISALKKPINTLCKSGSRTKIECMRYLIAKLNGKSDNYLV